MKATAHDTANEPDQKTERETVLVTVRLSESLLSVFRDSGRPLPECSQLRIKKGTPLRQVLGTMGISPLLVPMASLDNCRVGLDVSLEAGGTLILYGPLAGG